MFFTTNKFMKAIGNKLSELKRVGDSVLPAIYLEIKKLVSRAPKSTCPTGCLAESFYEFKGDRGTIHGH